MTGFEPTTFQTPGGHSIHCESTECFSVAQWIERPSIVRKVVSSNPVTGSQIFSEYYWFEKRR